MTCFTSDGLRDWDLTQRWLIMAPWLNLDSSAPGSTVSKPGTLDKRGTVLSGWVLLGLNHILHSWKPSPRNRHALTQSSGCFHWQKIFRMASQTARGEGITEGPNWNFGAGESEPTLLFKQSPSLPLSNSTPSQEPLAIVSFKKSHKAMLC